MITKKDILISALSWLIVSASVADPKNALPKSIVIEDKQEMKMRIELTFVDDVNRTLHEKVTMLDTGKIFDERTSKNYKLQLFCVGEAPYSLATSSLHLSMMALFELEGKIIQNRLELIVDGKKMDAYQLWKNLSKVDKRFILHEKPLPEPKKNHNKPVHDQRDSAAPRLRLVP